MLGRKAVKKSSCKGFLEMNILVRCACGSRGQKLLMSDLDWLL